ncbi:MAG: 16S rRNA processing protein RimM [Chloroflexi bacterium]|nr:16S rRNA processing protein RimM [Chloroflexota bacterium]
MAGSNLHTDEIPEGYVAIGRVIGAHGLRGDLKIEPLAPESCLQPDVRVLIGDSQHAIERFQHSANRVILKLSGIDGRQRAQSLRGSYLQVREETLEPLPEGQYYRFQIIGLNVRSTDGRGLGRIVSVIATGANDAYEVEGPIGAFLIPATAEVVTDIDLASRTMTIDPLPGLLPSD